MVLARGGELRLRRVVDGKEPTPLQAEFARLWQASRWKRRAHAARQLGVSPSTIGRYLDCSIEPSLPVLRLFADLLGERLNLTGESPRARRLSDGPRWLEEWESDVVQSLRRLPPPARQQVIRGLTEILEAVSPSVRYPRSTVGGPVGSGAVPVEEVARDIVSGLNDPAESTQQREPEREAPGRRRARPAGSAGDRANAGRTNQRRGG